MARPIRVEFPGAVYHVTSRGNARQPIFERVSDKMKFLSVLDRVVKRYNWICHAYCLMDNHYHLLIETIDPTLSVGMRQLNGVYTQFFNRTYQRTGHLFQGRFKSILVEKDRYLLELCRYIVLNPVRAKMVSNPNRYAWSSYNATLGSAKVPSFLTTDWILAHFDKKRLQAQKKYQAFVQEGINLSCPWEHLKAQCFLGGESFISRMKRNIAEKRQEIEIPSQQRNITRPQLEELFKQPVSKQTRNTLIQQAVLNYGYKQKELADYLGLHYSSISRLVNEADDKMSKLKT